MNQFTGRYDFTGKEIYGADIVSFTPFTERKVYTGIVEYDNDSASFCVRVKDYPIKYISEIEEMTVLGNIYENKELINETAKV